jgi:hypothetical protein
MGSSNRHESLVSQWREFSAQSHRSARQPRQGSKIDVRACETQRQLNGSVRTGHLVGQVCCRMDKAAGEVGGRKVSQASLVPQ